MHKYTLTLVVIVSLSVLSSGCTAIMEARAKYRAENPHLFPKEVVSPEPEQKPPTSVLSPDAYGENIAGTPYAFVKLTVAEKAALHWAASQEYLRLHSSKPSNAEVGILAEMHGMSSISLSEKANHWDMPEPSIWQVLNGLPLSLRDFEKWRAQRIEQDNTRVGVARAVARLEQAQIIEQKEFSLHRHGCEWMIGKYYVNSAPSSLCTPVLSGCAEGDCTNGHGTYVSFDGTKYIGYFEDGARIGEDTVTAGAYGSNESATPHSFTNLLPEQKAALHWITSREYVSLHDPNRAKRNPDVLAALHGMSAKSLEKMVNGWQMSEESIRRIINQLPYRQHAFEKWRAQTIERQNTSERLPNLVELLAREQLGEQAHNGMQRSGCGWMTGEYYLDRNPSALCTPVVGTCIEGDCINGHGVYVLFTGVKFSGTFKDGKPISRDKIYPKKTYIIGSCTEGNCTNGHGTYVFSDGSKYVGDFKDGLAHGKGSKSWMVGIKYSGDFDHGVATQEESFTVPAKQGLSKKTCLEGNCIDGQGTLTYPNDTKYVGAFKSGQPSGQGIYLWRDGEALRGDFENGFLIKGEYIFQDGSRVAQNIRRSWHETYAEEAKAAQDKADRERAERIFSRFLFDQVIDSVVEMTLDNSWSGAHGGRGFMQ